ncbi:MAG TPA: hypothetical protein VFQ91_12270 [Bryobacteraceae bacterium]|nr:hypothetical protein [Bryobacteraceae bacterium]
MEREQWDRLLASYATGGLSEEEKKALFAEALTDQALFDQLMEEDELRELLEMPGARNQLIDSLQEESVLLEMAAAPAPAAPMAKRAAAPQPVASGSPATPQKQSHSPHTPVWFAWAAGVGVVFVSGMLTYMMFDRPSAEQVAQAPMVHSGTTSKPFVAPPAANKAKPRPAPVEEPPKILADSRVPASAPVPQLAIPLPGGPPPPAPAPRRESEFKQEARLDRDQAKANAYAAPEVPRPTPQPMVVAPPAASQAADELLRERRLSAPESAGSGGGVASEAKAKTALSAASIWRRTGDGVWTRVPDGDAVGRSEVLAIRYVPASARTVVLRDLQGQTLVRKIGNPGVEMELIVPPSAISEQPGATVQLSLVEEAVPGGVGVGALARSRASAQTAPKIVPIILRLR